jgi:putative oxidoreductase
MRPGQTTLRAVVGALFVGHGTQKLFGWFEGGGLEGTAQMFENLGLRPGRRHAVAAGVAEAGGGALLITGAANPLASAALTATMLTAIRRVHFRNGPWITKGGFEYNLVLIAAALALAPPSRGRGQQTREWPWTLAALAGGIAGAGVAELAARAGEQEATDTEAIDLPADPDAGHGQAGPAGS